jgi:outer membrane protein OmpA-like peptidoglycan-associated protein
MSGIGFAVDFVLVPPGRGGRTRRGGDPCANDCASASSAASGSRLRRPDSDRDGVLTHENDQCPGTPAGTAVDPVGCPRKGSVTLEGVTFETNSATLTSTSRPVLDKVAAAMSKYPRLKVEVQGHTDSSGSDSHNMKLSQQRAESVREYLISQGVAASQMTAKGYGETEPVADNSSEAGRAQNRRVVLHVTENPGDVEVKEAPACAVSCSVQRKGDQHDHASSLRQARHARTMRVGARSAPNTSANSSEAPSATFACS